MASARSFQASQTDIVKVKQAFHTRGWTMEYLAMRLRCSRQTVSKFFAGKSVSKEIFINICSELGLKWEEIVDWDLAEVASKDTDIITANCDTMPQLTTPGGSTGENQQSAQKVAYAITGTVDKVDLPQIQAILALLQKKTGDFSIEIVDIEEGSVRLILEGSQVGLEQIETLFKSGQLTEVLGIPVLDAQFITAKDSELDKKRLVFTIDTSIYPEDLQSVKAELTKASDNNKEESKTKKKSRLVQEIYSQGARGRDLSRANLSDVHLSGAKVENARVEGSFGITQQMKQDLIQRGAIFNDSPGDRSQSLVPH